jgi:hypothetical protein
VAVDSLVNSGLHEVYVCAKAYLQDSKVAATARTDWENISLNARLLYREKEVKSIKQRRICNDNPRWQLEVLVTE